jgi:hypothetical protein
MSALETEIAFLTEFDRLIGHDRNLELESAAGNISTKQLLAELKDISAKAEQTLEALRESKAEDSAG